VVNLAFKATCAAGENWQSVAEQCLQNLGNAPTTANLGFLYITDPLAPWLNNLLAELRTQTGVKNWIGTVGAGICYTGLEVYDEPAAAIMLTTLPEDSYRLLPGGMEAMSTMLEENRHWIAEQAVHFGIVHGDPRNTDLARIIESLSTNLDPGFLVGGLSSAHDHSFLQQIAGQIYENSVSGVLLSSRIPVITGLTQGCTPMAARHTITRSDGKILAEIDGRPALDVFKEDIGEDLAKDISRVGDYIFLGLPVPGSDTGDYLVRDIMGIDADEKLLMIGANLENNIPIMFCRRDDDTAREDMIRMLTDLRKRANGPIKGGVYYTCLGRGRNQFGEGSKELKLIQEQLGDFPLVGFFAYGEIAHNRVYGYTGVLTLFL
jgi:small ligand-binding sensory domain FIST